MKIIILEDLKGFRKTVEVPFFPPVYEIAELPPIKVEIFDHSKTYPDTTLKSIRFFQKGDVDSKFGMWIALYKQME